jgi:hypothetical protein
MFSNSTKIKPSPSPTRTELSNSQRRVAHPLRAPQQIAGSAGANRDSPRRRLKSANTTPTQGLAIFGMKRRKDVKIFTRALTLTSLAAFTFFFAASTPAQRVSKLPPMPYGTPASPEVIAAETQQKSQHEAATPDATTTCTYKFTSGSGATYLQFCVTVNGNIVEFNSPEGIEQLSPKVSPPYEGYGICDNTNGATAYYDYAANGDSGNWDAATKVSSTATSVKIERSTSDGAWTLTQTITSIAGANPYAKVVMALKNNSGVTKYAYLLRFANMLPTGAGGGTPYYENYDGDADSAWGYSSYSSCCGEPYGLMLQNVGNPAPLSALSLREGFPQDTLGGPDPCDPVGNYNGTVTGSNGSGVYLYVLSLNKNQTVTVTDRYQAF